jgi:hypothetical protein
MLGLSNTPSGRQLNRLANARACRWVDVDAVERSMFACRLVRARWRKTTYAQRHQLGITLSQARWHPPPDPKAAQGGGPLPVAVVAGPDGSRTHSRTQRANPRFWRRAWVYLVCTRLGPS